MVAPQNTDGLAVDTHPESELTEAELAESTLLAVMPISKFEYETKERPIDWPDAGPIDLAIHDLPHASSAMEWWYLNSHMTTEDGRDISIFASFFRVIKSRNEKTKAIQYAHSLTWAISDNDAAKYYTESWVDPDAPRLGLEKLDRGEGASDPRLRRALREMLVRDSIPYPDQVMDEEAFCSPDKLDIEIQRSTFFKQDDGSYRLRLYHEHHKVGCDLVFRPQMSPLRHGEDGIVQAPDGGDMFYYFIPKCSVEGSLTLQGSPVAIADGAGWYDHEFGGHRAEDAIDREIAWNWVALQLDDGRQITAYTLVDANDLNLVGQKAIVIHKDGKATRHDDVEIYPLNMWRSTRTFNVYPTRWRMKVPSADLELQIEATFDDQEFVSLISKPAFWEGRVDARGALDGVEVSGKGYLERSGFGTIDTLEGFFEAVGEETRKSVRELIPYNPTYEQTRNMIASEERDEYMEGVSIERLVETLVAPVREIADRGGKCWRSYAALACCDAVGGDSRDYVHWLAMPELMHVGSLIVDDVQDRSDIRRGGPACHVVHGDAIAINAGTAAYFMGQQLLASDKLSKKDQLRIYDLYFQALRAGHAGQALDLAGADDLLPDAIESGDTRELAQRVLSIHRLKTAVPAGSLARMGAVAGGGTEEQIQGMGQFFEALGIAFQIVDDVLNLQGFAGDLKLKGEDIGAGKITAPIVSALSALDYPERVWLGRTLQSQPQDPETIAAVIDLLREANALDRCMTDAEDLMEVAWHQLDPLVEDSIPKLMLRAFSWFVLQRHY